MSWRDKPCKPWPGAMGNHGYGMARHEGQPVLAHRLSFFEAHGRWPEPCCLHRCDNRPCTEPSHLFEGTKTDNNRDMTAKGRHWSATQEAKNKGARHAMAKLSEQDVMDIRANFALCRVTQKELASRFGVSPTAVCRILKGRTWRSRKA